MKTYSSTIIGRVAIALAGVAALGLIFITLFYTFSGGIGGPFGTLNDICVALGGLLSGVLIWHLNAIHRTYAPRMSRLALLVGLAGACLAPIGSGFAIFNVTGWFLAGLVTTYGYALIGLWLLGLNVSALAWGEFPRRLANFGIVSAAITAIGLLVGPGIITQTDAVDSAQWFILIGLYVGGLGWNILYAIWCIWLGRLLFTDRLVLPLQRAGQQIWPNQCFHEERSK